MEAIQHRAGFFMILLLPLTVEFIFHIVKLILIYQFNLIYLISLIYNLLSLLKIYLNFINNTAI